MSIPTEFHFHGLEPSPTLEAYAIRWLDRVSHVADGITSCAIRIEMPHRHHRRGRQFHVVLSLAVPGRTLTVSRDPGAPTTHESAYAAVRDAFLALRRQLDDFMARRAHPAAAGA